MNKGKDLKAKEAIHAINSSIMALNQVWEIMLHQGKEDAGMREEIIPLAYEKMKELDRHWQELKENYFYEL